MPGQSLTPPTLKADVSFRDQPRPLFFGCIVNLAGDQRQRPLLRTSGALLHIRESRLFLTLSP
jgi:hypothetical protein